MTRNRVQKTTETRELQKGEVNVMSRCVSNFPQSSSNKPMSILQYLDISALFSINTSR